MIDPASVAAYLEHVATLGHSANTLRLTRFWLELFADWCRVHALDQLKPEQLQTFRTTLSWVPGRAGHIYAANTVYQAVRMIRAFLRWSGSEGSALTADLVLPRPLAKPLRLLSPDELDRLLHVADGAGRLALRDRLLLELLCEGIPLRVCTGLQLSDVVGARVRGRALSSEAAEVLERYLREGRPQRGTHPALFVSLHGRALTPGALHQRVRLLAQMASLSLPTPAELAASRRVQRDAFARRRLAFCNGKETGV